MCAAVYRLRHLVKATKVNAGLAESNGRLLLGIWRDSLHVACGLTACTSGSAPGPTLGNEYGKTLPFTDQARNHSSQSDGTEYHGILSSLVGYLISAAQQSCDMAALLHCLQIFRLTKPYLTHSTIPPTLPPPTTLFSSRYSVG